MGYPYAPNSPVWSSDEASPYYSPASQYGSLAVAAGLTAGGIYASRKAQVSASGLTVFDLVQAHVRVISEASPFAILNTFRTAEFMSSLSSPAMKGMTAGVGGEFTYNYESEFLKGKETRDYLRRLAGDEAFKKAGIDLDLSSDFEVQYRQKKGDIKGTLFARTVQKGQLGQPDIKGQFVQVAKDLTAMEKTPYETVSPTGVKTTNIKSINPAAFGVLQQMGFTEELGPYAESTAGRLFTEYGANDRFIQGKGLLPVRLKDLPGGVLAFEMNRPNRLLRDTFDQIPILGDIAEKVARAAGITTEIQTGNAAKMFGRFGLFAGKIGLGIMGIQQIDWFRRNYELPGEMIASGAVSVGAAALTQRVIKSGSPKTAAMVGVASFFGQMLLPGFDQGVFQGIATTATKAHIAASAIGSVTLMNTYRRTVEGLLPGFTGMEVGALAGLGLVGLSVSKNRIFDKLSDKVKDQIGLRGFAGLDSSQLPLTQNQMQGRVIGENIFNYLNNQPTQDSFLFELDKRGIINLQQELQDLGFYNKITNQDYSDLGRVGRTRLAQSIYTKASAALGAEGSIGVMKQLHTYFEQGISEHRDALRSNSPINASYVQRLNEIESKYNFGSGLTFGQRAQRAAERFGATLVHSFFGSSLESEEIKNIQKISGYRPKLGRLGTLFATGFLAHQLLTGGLLGSMEDPSELAAVYSGREKVAVKRGRWWEGGGTPFEGGEVEYYRPHAYVDLMTRSRQKAVWGRNEDEISPIRKFFLKNFTYYIEETNYHNRPYPITGAAFEDIPVIGGILSATLGRLVKPAKLMHTSEYMRMGSDGNIEFLHRAQQDDPSLELGGKTPGVPTSPYSLGIVAAQTQYQYRELAGLTGFATNTIQQALTGTQTFGTQRPIMASAGSMTDPGEAFWDLNLGGGLFTTEALRRFFPNKQSEVEEYNPLLNRMPYWMPDRFKYGDPYRNVKQGYMRMPGAGYEALHPELAGFSMEEYPDIYKYSILADVAPMSKEFMQVRERMYQRRSQEITTDAENALMDSIDNLYNQRMRKADFDYVDKNAIEIPVASSASQYVYEQVQKGVRKGVAPVEYMIPAGFRPVQKILSDRDMIEEYEYGRMYGSQFAFWDKPMRDWFRPAFYSAANLLGFEGKPVWRQEVDDTQQYFDQLEFQKRMMLAQQASMMGDNEAARRNYIEANKTRFGINPQASAMSIYMSLPEADKKFFDAFSSTQNAAERERIMEMIPADQVALYQSIWKRVDEGDSSLYRGSIADYDVNQLNRKFHELQSQGVSGPRPPVDWIGWRDDVQLDDIQLKYIESMGKEIHDYGFWESQRRDLARKEYLQGSEEFLNVPGRLSPFGPVGKLYHASKISPDQRLPMESSGFLIEGGYQRPSSQLYYNDNRSGEYSNYINGMLNDVR